MKDLQSKDNVIKLFKKENKHKSCHHNSIIIDDELSEATCEDCGEKLNPIAVLMRYAKKEKNLLSELELRAIKFDNISQRLGEKCRTKCKHCGKITPVNIELKHNEWRGWVSVKPKVVK